MRRLFCLATLNVAEDASIFQGPSPGQCLQSRRENLPKVSPQRDYTPVNEVESDVYGWLFFDHGWPEAIAQRIDDAGAWLTLLAGISVLVPGWRRIGRDAIACTVIAIWILAMAVTHSLRGDVYAEWSLAETAVRYAAPLALICLTWKPDHRLARPIAIGLLTLATAATFTIHGVKAIQLHGPFTDLILLSNLRWTNWDLSQSLAERILLTIGWVDCLVAACLLLARSRPILLYMMFWGFITAASRTTAFGLPAWPETLLRAANGGLPLVLLLLTRKPNP